MPKDEEHIIDWILKKTDHRKQRDNYRVKKRASAFEQRKHKMDNLVFYCSSCKACWSKVPKWIDIVRWRKYPRGLMPTIGKKRKKCPSCENE